MIAEPRQRLSFSRDADAGRRVQALDLDDGQRYVAVEDSVVSLVDPFAATLAKEILDLITAVREGRGDWGRGGPVRHDGSDIRLRRGVA